MGKMTSIVLAGVGGKGIITATHLLSRGLVTLGYDVKVSEVHGMSQRGGSVFSQVRFGEKIYSPLIERGTADIVAGFDLLEALRWSDYLKQDGHLIVNNINLKIGSFDGSPERGFDSFKRVDFVEATRIAKETGSARNDNFVMLGALVKALGFGFEEWCAAVEGQIRPQHLEAGLLAIKRGMEQIRSGANEETGEYEVVETFGK